MVRGIERCKLQVEVFLRSGDFELALEIGKKGVEPRLLFGAGFGCGKVGSENGLVGFGDGIGLESAVLQLEVVDGRKVSVLDIKTAPGALGREVENGEFIILLSYPFFGQGFLESRGGSSSNGLLTGEGVGAPFFDFRNGVFL